MALTDVTVTEDVNQAVRRLNRAAKHSVVTLRRSLLQAAEDANTYGTDALQAALGVDAAEFAQWYDNGRLYCISHKPPNTTADWGIVHRSTLPTGDSSSSSSSSSSSV